MKERKKASKKAPSVTRKSQFLRVFLGVSRRSFRWRLAQFLWRVVSSKPGGQGLSRLSNELALLKHARQTRTTSNDQVTPNRVAYVLHSSLPYSSNGYSIRGHGIARGLSDSGFDVVAYTRPGFPVDVKSAGDRNTVPQIEIIDGVPYHRDLDADIKRQTTVEYVLRSAALLERQFAESKPALVIGASNYLTGLMAMIAARRLGIPFAYEVRGWWEITKASRSTRFRRSEGFRVQRRMEIETARAADHVFALNAPMVRRLVEDGVDPKRITLFPNSCDSAQFVPVPRDEAIASTLGIPPKVSVIGYVGSFVDYEGLDDLAIACAELKRRGRQFRLLLVGNEDAMNSGLGPVSNAILKAAQKGSFADWLIMPGRVPHDEVATYYSLIDIATFPRKPWPVCELIPPMKPIEALAMGKAVVTSNVGALEELIQNGETGLLYEKSNNTALADALDRLILDPSFAGRLGRNGREWVLSERRWAHTSERAMRAWQKARESDERAAG